MDLWPILLCFACARDVIMNRGTKALDVGFLRGCLPDVVCCRRKRSKKRKRMECGPLFITQLTAWTRSSQPTTQRSLL